jgi:peptidylprolyl isomerase
VGQDSINAKGWVMIMAKAKNGDRVKVNYEGKLKDGTVFGSSIDHEPLEFKIGENNLIEAFEGAVVGMDVNESKTFEVPSKDAYGEYRDELVLSVERSELPPDVEPKMGERVELVRDELTLTATITEVSDDKITLDVNHPLAGKDLIFDIELLEIL